MVTATALDKFNSDQVRDFLRNASLIQEVGKLAAVDAFMGNTDRLSRTTVNTGNYMMANGEEGPTLVAIDNEMKAGYGKNKAAREGEVRFVMSQDGAAQLAQSFIVKLTGNFTKYRPTGGDLTFVETNMKLGIKAGAEAIMALMKSQPNFIDNAKAMEKTQLPGPQGTHFKQRELVRETMKTRLKAMKEAYESGGWAKLAPALE
jgi:hypothetical protein